MSAKLEMLSQRLHVYLGDRIKASNLALGELRIDVGASDYPTMMQTLRDKPELDFAQLIDLCSVDYSTYGNQP